MMPQRSRVNAAKLLRLLAFSRDLLQTPDFESALKLIGAAVYDVLAPDGALLLVSMGGHEHRIEFDRHGVVRTAHTDAFLLRHIRQAMKSDRALVLTEADSNGDALVALAHDFSAARVASVLAVNFPPLKPAGALLVFWNRKMREQFLTGRVSLLQQLAELIGASFGSLDWHSELQKQALAQTAEHAQEMQRRDLLEAEMHRISITDVMTGLKNRRGFFLQAEQSFKVAKRKKLVSAVIFADVDGLKAVNDKLGHDVGDQLIRDSARILDNAFRASDVVARLGGDEFAAFTFDDTQPGAILARISENIATFNRNSSRPYQVAFSTGIAQCDPASGLSLLDYLLTADKQMYIQKAKQHRFSPARQRTAQADQLGHSVR